MYVFYFYLNETALKKNQRASSILIVRCLQLFNKSFMCTYINDISYNVHTYKWCCELSFLKTWLQVGPPSRQKCVFCHFSPSQMTKKCFLAFFYLIPVTFPPLWPKKTLLFHFNVTPPPPFKNLTTPLQLQRKRCQKQKLMYVLCGFVCYTCATLPRLIVFGNKVSLWWIKL